MDVTDNMFTTVPALAVHYDRPELLALVLARGAGSRLYDTDRDGLSALTLAAKLNNSCVPVIMAFAHKQRILLLVLAARRRGGPRLPSELFEHVVAAFLDLPARH